jgi:Protein of unknown function (DUF4238)
MHWALLSPRAGYFITSDNPLARQVHRDTVHPVYGDMGFVNPTAEITFPLSPELMLLLVWEPRSQRTASLPAEFVIKANEIRAAQSDQYLYAHVQSPVLEQLAARFRDSRPTMTTEGLGPERFGRTKVGKK